MGLQAKIIKAGPSLIGLIFLSIFFVVYHEISQGQRKNVHLVIRSDATFYHEYIAVHIFGMEPYIPRTKKKVIKYTMGMAITYSPGIAAGYIVCKIKGIDHDYGRNYIYQRTLYYLGFIYALIGLLFLRLILRKWFDDFLVAIVLAIIFFGTNLYYYVNVEPLMSHAASFCFINGFIYFVFRLFENKKLKWSIGVGFFLGMIILIRPTNIIITLMPIIYLLSKKGALREQTTSLMKKPFIILLTLLIPVLLFIPQMIYWHQYTGKWLYDSYGKESFYFFKPAILQVLFSFRKGWFIYTPVMLLIIPGAVICFKQNRRLFWGILTFMIIHLYIMSSWWCWWYGGGFGMRPMIDFYGILSIWIAYFLHYIYQKRKYIFAMALVPIGFLVYINLHHTRMARVNILHFDSMTFKAYKEIFISDSNKNKYTEEEWDQLLDHPNYEKAFFGERFW